MLLQREQDINRTNRTTVGLAEKGCPEPEFETNGFFTAIFRPNPDVRVQTGDHVEAQSGPSRGPVSTSAERSSANTAGNEGTCHCFGVEEQDWLAETYGQRIIVRELGRIHCSLQTKQSYAEVSDHAIR